jgi:hypothetical protein
MLSRAAIGYLLLAGLAAAALAGAILLAPIAQDAGYHRFGDTRTIWSIPNFCNVVSNVPFALVGLWGLIELGKPGRLTILRQTGLSYLLLFFGTLLVGAGSIYYHLAPDNQTLLWDRLPITIAFMALFSITISEFISVRAGKALLFPLLLAGMGSVLYWYYTEMRGGGDLRAYVLVQFYPLLAIPVILACFPSKFTHAQTYWWLLLAYVIAKIFEHFDEALYAALGFVSGHSLKHLAAALGLYLLLVSYRKRQYA